MMYALWHTMESLVGEVRKPSTFIKYFLAPSVLKLGDYVLDFWCCGEAEVG